VRYPEDIQVIIRSDRIICGNLYVGNVEAAENLQLIDGKPCYYEDLQISAVLSVVKGYAPSHPKESVRYTKSVPLDDQDD